ncbi:MAG: hypothetical protein Ct9H90mP26_2690 [Methanobacteriota archaeon]|nr:MAG: hypothetical protein Ct9H90mP26_2690 [Euryarchaeota archaeon]
MYHHIRDEVNSNISDIPIRNANQGLTQIAALAETTAMGHGLPDFHV